MKRIFLRTSSPTSWEPFGLGGSLKMVWNVDKISVGATKHNCTIGVLHNRKMTWPHLGYGGRPINEAAVASECFKLQI